MNLNKRLSDEVVKARGLAALRRVREQAKKLNHKFTLGEINKIIAETRNEKS